MKKILVITSAVAALSLPVSACAQVRISEIAWMGIAGKNGQYGEWIELYNDADTAADVTGWKILKDNGSKTVAVLPKGSVPAGGYLVVKRSTASVPDPVPSVPGIAMAFANSGLSNNGEDLIVQDATGAEIQHLSYMAGWPAGDATTKETMQYRDGAWGTAAATPGAPAPDQWPVKNPIASSQSSIAGNADNSAGTATDTSAVNDGVSVAAQLQNSESVAVIAPAFVIKHIPAGIALSFPKTAYAGVQYSLSADVSYEDMHQFEGYFAWNFGDGTTAAFVVNQPVTHAYRYPGTYVVSFAYYNRKGDQEPLLQAQSPLAVSTARISLVRELTSLAISNAGTSSVDLSGWRITLAEASGTSAASAVQMVIPGMTMLAPRATMRLPFSVLGFSAGVLDRVTMLTGLRMPVAELAPEDLAKPASRAKKARAAKK